MFDSLRCLLLSWTAPSGACGKAQGMFSCWVCLYPVFCPAAPHSSWRSLATQGISLWFYSLHTAITLSWQPTATVIATAHCSAPLETGFFPQKEMTPLLIPMFQKPQPLLAFIDLKDAAPWESLPHLQQCCLLSFELAFSTVSFCMNQSHQLSFFLLCFLSVKI